MPRKRIVILGSTGSVGINALDVIAQMPERFEVLALSAFSNKLLFARQLRQFKPRYAAIAPEHMDFVAKAGGVTRKRILDTSPDSLSRMAALKEADIVVIALTGAVALDPFLAAACAGKTIAPANKEALVIAGHILMQAAAQSGARVIPVDSEQSAIFQCLQASAPSSVRALHLTASGGALRGLPRREHDKLSVARILAHPRWKMGAKITVDSATLMNKGFEVIEAMRLFDMSVDRVKVLVHPEAIIHSLVEFVDGAWLAQLGVADMRLPLQYALTYPERVKSALKPLDLAAIGKLHFEPPDNKTFPALELAYHAARKSGTVPAVLNAADEVAVEAFLKGRIRLSGIFHLVEKTVMAHRSVAAPSLDDIRRADAWARLKTEDFLKGIK